MNHNSVSRRGKGFGETRYLGVPQVPPVIAGLITRLHALRYITRNH
jgi:hypothetical protein